jgi:Na+/H+ ion antiporter subunit
VPFVRTVLFVLLWWAALFGWWVVLTGTNSGLEEIAAAAAALLSALLALALRRLGLLRYRFEARWLAKALKVPFKIVREIGVVFWALALHMAGQRRLSGRYRAFEFPAGGDDPTSAGRRAVAAEADALSPNTFPVDIDRERQVVLRHELDPRRASDEMP